jgi:hypothetical protein
MGFSALFGCFFAWTYHYRKLHKEPNGKPQRITETINIPLEIAAIEERDRIAMRRIEQEKTCYETDSANRDAFVKKLLELFHNRLEKEDNDILSLCYWAFTGEGFVLRLSITPYRLRENIFVPKSNRYFSKKEFIWNEQDEIPVDIFQSDTQITRSLIGSAISGDGKLRGFITMDSAMENAFGDAKLMELRELTALAEETLQILDLNAKFDNENNLLNGMLKDISNLFNSVSKSNLIFNLSKILQYNFKFDRLMIINLDKKDKEKWYISDAIGEQSADFKGISFRVHEKCLLYELLSGKTTVINETNIPTDPYQHRLFEKNEPENLGLRSLFAVVPAVQHNSYPVAIVLESKNKKAVSRIDIQMLTCLAACTALKLSDIMEKIYSKQRKENELIDVDSNGLGDTLNFYEREITSIKNSDECLGILLMKCRPLGKEKKVLDFNEIKAPNYEKFLLVLKTLKKNWNGRHLAMLGSGEFVFSIKGNFSEEVFDITSTQIIANARNMLFEDKLDVESHPIWLEKNKIFEKEQDAGYSCETIFKFTIVNKFKEMSGV